MRRHRYLTLVVLLVAVSLLATLIPTRAYARDTDSNSDLPTPEYSTWNDLSGKTVGMVTGATFETVLREKCPSLGEVVYYSSTSDLIAALQANKIDAFVNSTAVGTLAVNRYSDLALFPEILGAYDIGIAFGKGSDLTSKFSKIADRLCEDGTADKLWDK